jgi:hypothetical protein
LLTLTCMNNDSNNVIEVWKWWSFGSSRFSSCTQIKYIKIYIVTWCLKARIVEPEEMSVTRQWLGKQVSAAMNTQATTEELLGTMFSLRSMWSGNKRRKLMNWGSVGSRPVKRRLYVRCSTVIFGVYNSVRLL